METNEELDNLIKEKADQLNRAVESSRKYYGYEVGSGHYEPMDLFETVLAFDSKSLLETEFETLLAKRFMPLGWEHALISFEAEADRLRTKIDHWKKKELPPWNGA